MVALQNRGAIPYRELTASSCRNGQLLEIDMRTIVSALIALSVLAGVAVPASALDAKTFYEQQDRTSY